MTWNIDYEKLEKSIVDYYSETHKVDIKTVEYALESSTDDDKREILQLFCTHFHDGCDKCSLRFDCVGFAQAEGDRLLRVWGIMLRIMASENLIEPTHKILEAINKSSTIPAPTQFSEEDLEEYDEEDDEYVNHPNHYATGNFECIDVMQEAFDIETVRHFCLGNAFKYLYRCYHKFDSVEDIKKAKWYIDKYLELSEVEE